jgi:Protein of unknown function (DUF1499)
MGLFTAFAIIAFLGLLAFIRLAPSDPAVWNADMSAPGFRPRANAAVFCPRQGDRFAPELSDPVAVLGTLDAIALATPRTERLAGSPQEGRITWITRSLVMGFPDYTTAQILEAPGAPRLCIVGRQRFGAGDGGVNARRVRAWAQTLVGTDEPPDLGRF